MKNIFKKKDSAFFLSVWIFLKPLNVNLFVFYCNLFQKVIDITWNSRIGQPWCLHKNTKISNSNKMTCQVYTFHCKKYKKDLSGVSWQANLRGIFSLWFLNSTLWGVQKFHILNWKHFGSVLSFKWKLNI